MEKSKKELDFIFLVLFIIPTVKISATEENTDYKFNYLVL